MSRRRKPARGRLPVGWSTVTLVCTDPKRQGHAEERIATVSARLGVDETDIPHRVRVDYGSKPKPVEDVVRETHMTRRFRCSRCGMDFPAVDDRLAPLIVAIDCELGRRKFELAYLPDGLAAAKASATLRNQ